MMRTEGALGERSRLATRLCALVFLVGFVGAGLWLAFGIQGFNQLSVTDPGAALNPLLDPAGNHRDDHHHEQRVP